MGRSGKIDTDEAQVLCSVVKWCWSRLPGGVVSWDAYELFKVGESGMAEILYVEVKH